MANKILGKIACKVQVHSMYIIVFLRYTVDFLSNFKIKSSLAQVNVT